VFLPRYGLIIRLARPANLLQMYRESAFVRFLAVGVLNTAVGYSLLVTALLTIPAPLIALAVATIIGVLFNFITIGGVVFGMRDPRLLARFIGVYAVIFVYNALGLAALDAVGVGALPASAILLPGAVAGSFILNRRFVFGEAAKAAA
jgi:putative flippase GtrA